MSKIETFPGHVIKLHSIELVEVTVKLPLGVDLRRLVIIDGVNPAFLRRDHVRDAWLGMIILLGGKDIVIEVDRQDLSTPLPGAVYLNDRARECPPSAKRTLPDYTEPLLDVAAVFSLFGDSGNFCNHVKRILNGSNSGRAVHTR